MKPEGRAVVVGSLGVIGRYIVDRLRQDESWSTVGLSRREAADAPRYRHIAVDLLNRQDVEAKLAALTDVTHIFYAAFQAAPGAASGYASNIAPNRDMLINAVTAIAQSSKMLRRVVLVTGTKYYGTHLGPFKTPARESDPRHMPPNYYFDQIDWLTAFQRGRAWDWVELRPQTLIGFAPGTPMSILPAIAVYAAVSKELGLPLRFPGKPGAYAALYQVTESAHFANAALWAATEPRCGLEAFNITNGDYFRWKNLWPRLADVFEMPAGEPQAISLTQHMADKGGLWRAMVETYRLEPYDYGQLVGWPFADYVFGTDWDVMSNVTKSRQFGFHDVVDTEDMFCRLLRRFREARIVP
ncbi:MAG: SDR family oxidoreductase [Hyphomonadaceae bacterium]|jgi:nucleoside-diphosphate-sugar epimerase|nr:SDR family oxidoreductase [Hyphomonadaceae bacterium]